MKGGDRSADTSIGPTPRWLTDEAHGISRPRLGTGSQSHSRSVTVTEVSKAKVPVTQVKIAVRLTLR